MGKFKRLISLLFLLVIVLIPINAKANDTHGLELKAVVCDSTKYTSDVATTNAVSCYKDYKNGLLDTYVKENGDKIDKGTLVIVVLSYTYGGTTEVTAINSALSYDPDIWVPLKNGSTFLSQKNTSAFPQEGDIFEEASWSNQFTLDEDASEVVVSIYENSGYHIAFDETVELGYFFMTVSDDAPDGADAEINFNTSGGNTFMSNGDGDKLDFVTDNISFEIPGESVSTDASLKSLTISNSETIYPLSPDFVVGSVENKTYNVVVPNDISYVDINATTNDSGATILPGGLGKKDLSVGNNPILITVSSLLGNQEIYTVNVYRLSNDATLSAINFANDISVGKINAGQYAYSTTIPYAINSTVVGAVTNHENAYVDSGNGSWSLPNSGDLSNNRIIVVKAENCRTEYASVKGNTCTTQNYSLTINRVAASSNNYLKSLSAAGTPVSGFVKTTNDYDLGNVSFETTSILINGSVEDTGKATVSGLGTHDLNVGENTIKVVVTAEDGSKNIYTLKVYRLSNDKLLKELNISSDVSGTFTPDFTSSFTGDYTYKYDATSTELTIEAIVNDTNKAKVLIYDVDDTTASSATSSLNTQTKKFGIETTNVKVVVTAEDGTTNIYSVKLERATSTDNTLKILEVKETVSGNNVSFTDTFKPDVRTYYATVEGNVTSVDINAVPNSDYGNIKSISENSKDLQFGNNQIEVKVEAEDKSTSSYIINLTRKEYDISTLDKIIIDDVELKGFASDKTEYTLDSVAFSKDSLKIEVVKTNEYATVSGDIGETVSLTTGENELKILVTAQNGVDKTEYILNIKRDKNSDNSINNLTVKGVTATQTDVNIFEVTLPNSVTKLTPSDILFDYSSDATIKVDQTLELSTKVVNDYRFTVTSESGLPLEYSIKVTREEDNNASISKVTIFVGDNYNDYCEVTEGTYICNLDVPVSTTEFTLEAIIDDDAEVVPNNGEVHSMPAEESYKEVTLTVTAEDGTTEIYTVKITRQKSANNNLSSLTVDDKLVDGFSSNQLTYEMEVDGDTESVNIGAIVEDTGKAKIVTDLSRPFALEFDKRNKIEVVVEAEDTTQKTYTIYITRNRRVDVSLKDLTIGGITIDGFEPNKLEYNLDDLLYNTHKLNIVATPNDSNAKAAGDGLIDIKTGSNKIEIIVTAHDSTITETYVINVNRALNTDAGIQGISLNGVDATYNTETKKYEVTVTNDVDEANHSNLIVTVNDPIVETDVLAKISFTDTPLLTTTKNEVEITVTAEAGNVKIYTLVVEREKSDDATLSSLTVTNGSFSPSFKSNIFEYEVILPVETEDFKVDAITTDSNATITSGTGPYDMDKSEKIVEVVVVSENLKETNTYTLNIKRTSSSENRLKEITLSEGTLEPDFDPDTKSYIVNVDGSIDKITVGATLIDTRGKITSGLGDYELNVGENPVTIKTKSESGTEGEYTIKIIRAKKDYKDLTALTVDGNSVPDFNKDTLNYTITEKIPYNQSSVLISATKSDSDASITIENATGVSTSELTTTGRVSLVTGINVIKVVVTAQNETTKEYTINIERSKNNNALLSLLSVKEHSISPTFDDETFDYTVTVKSDKETLLASEVQVTAQDSKATIKKDGDLTLSTDGENIYKVEVTAEDGETKELYTIKVIRPKSSDATLKGVTLSIGSLTSPFSPEKTEYTISIPYGETDFTITALATDSKTKVVGDGDHTLSEGSFEIVTTAEDGTTKTYVFNIIEAASTDATLSSLSVDGYKLDKAFNSATLTYSIGNIPYSTEKLKINAIASNSGAKIEYFVDGVKQDSNIVNIPSVLATKTIEVKVTAADGIKTKNYNIYYTLVPSSNNYLSILSPSVGEIDFDKTIRDYHISVNNDVTSIDIELLTEDSNASVSVNGGAAFFTEVPKTVTISDLKVGNNTVTIKVTAQNNSSDNYNLVIKRNEPVASNDAYLSDLSVEGYPLDKSFNMNTEEYSIGQIPYSLTSLTINAIKNHSGSTLTYLVNGTKQNSNVINIPLTKGDGAITVKVVAEDGETFKNYKITYNKVPSENAYLQSIIPSVGSLDKDFNKNTFEYIVKVARTVNSIDITATLEDSKTIMKINGTTYSSPHTYTISPLEAGKTEIIIVNTAENGTVLTYKVIVDKEADPASTITSLEYGHSIINGYIKTVALNTTGLDMKNQLDNENEYLEIWTADETKQVEDNEKLATGMIVKLMIDGVEKDRKYIVIKGDTDGDSEVQLFDAVKILNHVLSRSELKDAYLEAAYLDDEEGVQLFDAVKILNHVLEKEQIVY